MKQAIPWEKIQYYLRHDDEAWDDDFVSWLNEHEENKQLWEETKLTYSITGSLPEAFEPNEKNAWQKVENRISTQSKKINSNQFFLRIAASLLLILLGASASWLIINQKSTNTFTEVYSPYGHKTMVILPDSSRVWLNGNTHLRYNTNFANARGVELTGEALFKVTKDKKHVFTVRSSNVKVEVYGTQFNVKHYPDDQQTEVALLEGSVGLFAHNKLLTKMTPGQVAEYDNNKNKVKVSQQDIAPIVSWSTDELDIVNKSFDEVLKYLERWYGVDIMTSKNLHVSHRLTFKVKTESLKEVLTIMTRVVPFQYKIDGKEVLITKK
ncbi:MAG TPA: FecR family protein [Sunxiuqinia sp.]|nr:FecR family protein [Sunxiuqinia sp.]